MQDHTTSATHAAEPLRRSAHDLQRAAGAMQKHAAGLDGVTPPLVVFAHLEEALDRLTVGVQMIGGALPERDAEEIEALRWHLAETARRLGAARDACAASRRWSRRPKAHKVAPPYLPPASDAIALGKVRTQTGEHRAVAALDDLDLTYRVLVTEPGGVQRELARAVTTLSEARRRAYAHFRELDRS